MCAECKCHTFIGNKICFILLFAFPRMLPGAMPFYLVADLHSNPMLTECSSCRAALFSGFSIPHTANIFHVFFAKRPLTHGSAPCDSSSLRLPILVSFFSIFYMQIEFSSILIGFLIGYTCVYIRTSRLAGSTLPDCPPGAGRPSPLAPRRRTEYLF